MSTFLDFVQIENDLAAAFSSTLLSRRHNMTTSDKNLKKNTNTNANTNANTNTNRAENILTMPLRGASGSSVHFAGMHFGTLLHVPLLQTWFGFEEKSVDFVQRKKIMHFALCRTGRELQI